MIHAWLNIPIRTNADNQRIGALLMYLESHGLTVARCSIVKASAYRGAPIDETLALWLDHPSMTTHLFERLVYSLAEMLHQPFLPVVYPHEAGCSPLGRGILVGPDAAQNLFDPAKFTI